MFIFPVMIDTFSYLQKKNFRFHIDFANLS